MKWVTQRNVTLFDENSFVKWNGIQNRSELAATNHQFANTQLNKTVVNRKYSHRPTKYHSKKYYFRTLWMENRISQYSLITTFIRTTWTCGKVIEKR